jgi:hypothetical protein
MKFLLDQDVYALTERFLRGLGYVVSRHLKWGYPARLILIC